MNSGTGLVSVFHEQVFINCHPSRIPLIEHITMPFFCRSGTYAQCGAIIRSGRGGSLIKDIIRT